METTHNNDSHKERIKLDLELAIEREMADACQTMEMRELREKAAQKGPDYLKGYLDGWGDGLELFLKYATANRKAVIQRYTGFGKQQSSQ